MTTTRFGRYVELRVEDEEVDVEVGEPSGYHLEGPEILETTKEKALEFVDALQYELSQARASLAGPSQTVDQRVTGKLAVELDAATRRIAGLEREVERLAGWLRKIDGGDNPCRDETKLRQWAYEALVLNNEPGEAS